jgi:hypothetical protein
MFAAWSRVRRSQQPAAYARKVLLNRHLPERPSSGGPSRQASRVMAAGTARWSHPQVRISGRGGQLPGICQGRRGPRPLRGAVIGPGALSVRPGAGGRDEQHPHQVRGQNDDPEPAIPRRLGQLHHGTPPRCAPSVHQCNRLAQPRRANRRTRGLPPTQQPAISCLGGHLGSDHGPTGAPKASGPEGQKSGPGRLGPHDAGSSRQPRSGLTAEPARWRRQRVA